MALPSKKWLQGMGKIRKGILGRISDVFKGKNQNQEDLIESLEQILVEGDMGVETTLRLMEDVRETFMHGDGGNVDTILDFLKTKIISILGSEAVSPPINKQGHPHVILVVGVNGTGKTTTIGKLASRFRNKGNKVLLACSDTFRAAAGEQLEVWGRRVGADIIRQASGADPASVAFDALNAAMARGVDVLLVDTAGRLHTTSNLREELKKIKRVLSKKMEGAPHEVLLVLDATVGQNGISQAKQFAEAVGVTGIVLTKLDGTARGGIVVAIHQILGIPIRWVGLGEGMDDLMPFDPQAFVEGMFGETPVHIQSDG
jgi:fused signal recognition particle receptor